MNKFVTTIAAAATFAATLGGTSAIAQEYKNQLKARQGAMWVMALNLGTLGSMAKGEAEYDAEAAKMAAESIHGVSQIHLASLFPEGSDAGMNDGTTAKAEIMSDIEGFNSAWSDLGAAAEMAASKAGDGQDALGPLMGALGGACGACHKKYRVPQE